jgi:hypothetical protein
MQIQRMHPQPDTLALTQVLQRSPHYRNGTLSAMPKLNCHQFGCDAKTQLKHLVLQVLQLRRAPVLRFSVGLLQRFQLFGDLNDRFLSTPLKPHFKALRRRLLAGLFTYVVGLLLCLRTGLLQHHVRQTLRVLNDQGRFHVRILYDTLRVRGCGDRYIRINGLFRHAHAGCRNGIRTIFKFGRFDDFGRQDRSSLHYEFVLTTATNDDFAHFFEFADLRHNFLLDFFDVPQSHRTHKLQFVFDNG